MEKIVFGPSLPGFEYGPKDGPAVVVIQEWWGVTEEIKEQAVHLAKKGGYRTLVPDLYKGKLGVDQEEAQHLMEGLDWQLAVKELTQAVDYLLESGATKVGVVGFCMGGALSFAAAQHAKVDAAAPFYGTPNPGICQVEKIKVPLLMQFGKEDKNKGFSDPETAQATYDKVNAAGGDAELHIYDKVGHAFLNGFTQDAIDKMNANPGFFPRPDNLEEVQSTAWSRLLDFFGKHLK